MRIGRPTDTRSPKAYNLTTDDMDRAELEQKISGALAARSNRVLNQNAISALFGAFSDPLGALGKLFLGREDALDLERQKLSQEAVLDLLCKIDDCLSEAAHKAAQKGIVIEGLFETAAHGADSVVGAHIADDSGPVVFKPGTHIRTVGTDTKQVTGLQIGGKR